MEFGLLSVVSKFWRCQTLIEGLYANISCDANLSLAWNIKYQLIGDLKWDEGKQGIQLWSMYFIRIYHKSKMSNKCEHKSNINSYWSPSINYVIKLLKLVQPWTNFLTSLLINQCVRVTPVICVQNSSKFYFLSLIIFSKNILLIYSK